MSERRVQPASVAKPGDSPLWVLCMGDGHPKAFYNLGRPQSPVGRQDHGEHTHITRDIYKNTQ